jgi:hypothetical protein
LLLHVLDSGKLRLGLSQQCPVLKLLFPQQQPDSFPLQPNHC